MSAKISARTLASTITGAETIGLIQGGADRRAPLTSLVTNVVTPERYGAVGDGVTDDTTAMQAALDSGSRGVFAKNSYMITTTLTLPLDQTLFGQPKPLKSQAVVNATNPPRIIYRGSANTVAIASAAQGSGVQDMMLDLNDNGSTAIQFSTGASYNAVRRVCFIGTMRLGLLADDNYVSDFEDLIFNGASVRTACVFIGLSNANIIRRVHTSGYPNDTAECLYGIAVQNGSCNRIEDCLFQGPTIGIATQTGSVCQIDNPYFENCLCNMRLGNLAASAGKFVVNGGAFSAPNSGHTQYAKRGPLNILACANATFTGPSIEATAANAAATGPWPFVLDSCIRFTLINPFHFGGTVATYARDLIYRRVSGSNTGITVLGAHYTSGTNYNAQELILKNSGAFGSSSHGIRVDNAGAITAVAYSPAIIFADIDALLQTNLPTGASLVI